MNLADHFEHGNPFLEVDKEQVLHNDRAFPCIAALMGIANVSLVMKLSYYSGCQATSTDICSQFSLKSHIVRFKVCSV